MPVPIAPIVISSTWHQPDVHNAHMGGHAGESMQLTHGQSLGTSGLLMTASLFFIVGSLLLALLVLALRSVRALDTEDKVLVALFGTIAAVCFGLAGACVYSVV